MVKAKAESGDKPVDPEANPEKLPEMLLVEKKKRKRKPPLVPWKKPKDMPRRPLSAYNVFFKEQREVMMATVAAAEQAAAKANPGSVSVSVDAADGDKPRSRKRSGKSVGIGFANLARTIAANWKDLDEATRAPYEAVAAKEKGRYKEEMLVWRAKEKRVKERAAAIQEEGAAEDQSPYPGAGGALDSSGETSVSMDDSHAATNASGSSSPRVASTSFPVQAARSTGMPNSTSGTGMPRGSMYVESPKKSRRSYQQPLPAGMPMDMDMDMFIKLDMEMDTGFNPIRLSSLTPAGRWTEMGPQSFPMSNHLPVGTGMHLNQPLNASLSRLDAMQANASISMGFNAHADEPGMAGMAYPFTPHVSDSAIGMPRVPHHQHFARTSSATTAEMMQQEERRLMQQQQRMMQQQQRIHQQHQQQQQQLFRLQQDMLFPNRDQQQHPAARRNTWSGGSYQSQQPANLSPGDNTGTEPGMINAVCEPGRSEARSSFTPPPSGNSGMITSTIPESWFEPDVESNPPVRDRDPQAPKLYPDTWFEVTEEEMETAPQYRADNEPMRYSPQGDLNGKLSTSPASGVRRNSPSTSMFHKPSRSHSGEGKTEEHSHPPVRTLEQIVGAGNPGSFPPSTCAGTGTGTGTGLQRGGPDKPNSSPESLEESSPFQGHGMQFDEDTMDFLARLRSESNQETPAN